jgi:hypothetical protein
MFMHPITMLSMTRESVRFEGLLHENCCPLSERRSPPSFPRSVTSGPRGMETYAARKHMGHTFYLLILTNDLYSLGIWVVPCRKS